MSSMQSAFSQGQSVRDEARTYLVDRFNIESNNHYGHFKAPLFLDRFEHFNVKSILADGQTMNNICIVLINNDCLC